MTWNWQQSDWPAFTYNAEALVSFEQLILQESGMLFGIYRHLTSEDKTQLRVEVLSSEALKTSEIEGEYLDRDSLQSSIRRHFGLQFDSRRIPPAETGVIKLMMDLYQTYDQPLDESMLCRWHQNLMTGRADLEYVGQYRKGQDPMQVVSGPVYEPHIHFEAPPSERIKMEMDRFIHWFNEASLQKRTPFSLLARTGIAHLYFESIHPFEDGNGRLGRALCEKMLAQGLGQPTLIALSTTINLHRKAYYLALESANKKNDLTDWLVFFSDIILKALQYTRTNIEFLIQKSKLFIRMQGQLNSRQEKLLLRLFREGPQGFEGGLSAAKYKKITKATPATATRDLHDLVEKGALIKSGELRYTRYYLPFSPNLE